MAVHVHTRGEGRPVVVLPAFGLDHNAMAEVAEPVFAATAGWSRLYADLPGTGASPPGEPRSDAVLEEVAGAIDSMLGGQRFLVAGWSYGGYLAAGLARRLPARVGGLLLICTSRKIRPHERNLTGVLPSSADHASYLAISNAGHYLPLEQPRLFQAAALSWLDECQQLPDGTHGPGPRR